MTDKESTAFNKISDEAVLEELRDRGLDVSGMVGEDIMVGVLEDMGYRVFHASDTRDALHEVATAYREGDRRHLDIVFRQHGIYL